MYLVVQLLCLQFWLRKFLPFFLVVLPPPVRLWWSWVVPLPLFGHCPLGFVLFFSSFFCGWVTFWVARLVLLPARQGLIRWGFTVLLSSLFSSFCYGFAWCSPYC